MRFLGGKDVPDILIASLTGLLAGFLFHRLAVAQVAKRAQEESKKQFIRKPLVLISWMLLSALVFNLLFLRTGDWYERVEYCIYISIALNIAAVDKLVCKIPNILLLALMLIKTIFIILEIVRGEKVFDSVIYPLIGLGCGFVLFLIPSLFHVKIGAGDLKFSGVIGFCLGIFNFIQAMIFMGAALLIYLLYLLATKKGNLKTAAAMGPFLSFGCVLTMLYPLYQAFLERHL